MKVLLLIRNPSNSNLYGDWIKNVQGDVSFVTEFGFDWIPPPECSLVITHDTYRPESCAAIFNCIKKNVPVLILSDGILEYRNSWIQKHRVDSGIFNPILGHKLACIGASQVRFLESIKGNFGKCENVGLPRLDDFKIESSKSKIPSILVCSSKTPWFSDDDKNQILQSFIDLKEIAFNYGQNHKVKFNWRISDHIASLIGTETSFDRTLEEDLKNSSAVITMPSTVMLEAMYAHKPVALLDYTLSPHYVSAGWTMSSRHQILPIINELLDPSTYKVSFQQTVLADALQIKESASARMIRLVNKMVEIGDRSRSLGKPLRFPYRMLECE